MDDISDHFCKNAVIVTCNKYREDRRVIEGLKGEISNNRELNIDHKEFKLEHNEGPEVEDDDEFTAIQNLSPSDFQKVIRFSLKNAAEVATAITSRKSASHISTI